MLKYKLRIITVFLTVSVIVLQTSGCGQSKSASSLENVPIATSSSEISSEAFSFDSGKAVFTPGSDPAEALSAQGEAQNTFTAKSCALPGDDTVYTYSGFSVSVNTDEAGKSLVTDVLLTDDSHTTAEGAYIGLSASDTKKLYGAPVESGDSYIYTKGRTELIFIIERDSVASIEYRLIGG